MKTIYATPRQPDDALSVNSGFESLLQVIEMIGMPVGVPTSRVLIYPDVVFSDFAFRLDVPVINA